MERPDKESRDISECPSDSAEAGKASVCEGCPGQAYCQSQGGVDPDQEGIDLRMGAIKHKILVLSGKGGVGKSTVATLLAEALASRSQKVGVIDLDICGPSVPKLLGVEGKPIVNSQYGWKPLVSPHYNIKVISVGSLLASDTNSVVFRGPRKSGLIKRFIKDTYWGRLDFLICDTPPGTSDEHLTVIKALKNVKPDGAVIVTTPQAVALSTIRKEINFCKKMGVRVLGLVGNMENYICPCCGESSELFPSEGLDNLAAEFNIPIIGRLPLDQEVMKCCEMGGNVIGDLQTSPIVVKVLNMAEDIRTMVDNL
ncbi:cytosolic Fe-S cluster assembly factor NUBP2 homolog [Mizuhopecten yessoensis]|uniref:Cytosolic Fe-S cluster assembly factor nubp1 n=1 Tax=Mizuhopecten yessoensis TaxID=6573 RepID=A0A210QZG9_MIZYE|nr:cytosolic Fe-S cluster assembly factor NUBP2 homolog [Mizuhopecten yessoensis]OWF54112.1 Cytosolic Fe-S cluster assembly factor nubp1 [Mizuhopecten yessoensis]